MPTFRGGDAFCWGLKAFLLLNTLWIRTLLRKAGGGCRQVASEDAVVAGVAASDGMGIRKVLRSFHNGWTEVDVRQDVWLERMVRQMLREEWWDGRLWMRVVMLELIREFR